MVCRYCGQECNANSSLNLWTKYGVQCKQSPTKKHVLVSDGVHCVYCGHECKPSSNMRIWTKYGPNCKSSPSNNHTLQ